MWCSVGGSSLFQNRYTYEAEVIIVVGQQTSCLPELPETSGASGWKVGCVKEIISIVLGGVRMSNT